MQGLWLPFELPRDRPPRRDAEVSRSQSNVQGGEMSYSPAYYKAHRDRIAKANERWRRTHQAQLNVASRKRRAEHRLSDRTAALKAYGGDPPRCACCGERALSFLVLDHIGGNGAEHRRRNHDFRTEPYTWLRRRGFPAGFRVLCWNCNGVIKPNQSQCSVHGGSET